MDFSFDKLKEKKGPLPLWAWIVLVAGVGYFGYTMFLKKPAPLPGNDGTQGPEGEFESSQSVTKTDEQGNQITSSYSARGAGTATGQMYYNAQQLQPQQGNIYVNVPGQQNPGEPATPAGANYLGRSNGWYMTTWRDMYPQEVAQHAYNLPDFQGKPDFASLAYDAVAIMLANPGVKIGDNNIVPKGTKLFIPGSHGNPNGGSTWNDLVPEDKGYKPGPMVPAPQQTRQVTAV